MEVHGELSPPHSVIEEYRNEATNKTSVLVDVWEHKAEDRSLAIISTALLTSFDFASLEPMYDPMVSHDQGEYCPA